MFSRHSPEEYVEYAREISGVDVPLTGMSVVIKDGSNFDGEVGTITGIMGDKFIVTIREKDRAFAPGIWDTYDNADLQVA